MKPTDNLLIGIWNKYSDIFEDKYKGWELNYYNDGLVKYVVIVKGNTIIHNDEYSNIIAGLLGPVDEFLDTITNYYTGKN